MSPIGKPHSPTGAQALHQALAYRGPERRGGSGLMARLMAKVLDEIDYGLILVADGHHVLHANHAARAELTAEHPLQLLGRELRPRFEKDVAPLREALTAAATRGLRRMLALGEGAHRAGVSVVPLLSVLDGAGAAPATELDAATLLVLGKRQVCGTLSVQGFARAHGLSPSEELVLRALCEGDSPQEIADRHGVKIATVRTQISNVRAKTQADSIRNLVQQVAVLPPLVGALRQSTYDWMGEAAAA